MDKLHLSTTDLDRFWSRVNKTNTCWFWVGGPYAMPYGSFWYAGRSYGAHRAAYCLASKAQIPRGMAVCHTCDTPKCVNPAHLFLGTKGDNNRDRARKGRSNIGSARPTSKLVEGQVLLIKELYSNGQHSYRSLARDFSVTPNTVGQILRGETWTHLSAS